MQDGFRKARNALLVLAASVAVTACVSFGGGKTPPFLLTLTADNVVAVGSAVSGPQSGAIVVDLPVAARKVDQLRVPVQTTPSTVAYLVDAYWIDKPNRLFQSLLASTIAANKGRLVLTSTQAGGKAETTLAGELMNFGVDTQLQSVIVTYDAVRLRDGQPVDKKRFEAREAIGVVEAAPVGEALNRAANKVAKEVSDWLG